MRPDRLFLDRLGSHDVDDESRDETTQIESSVESVGERGQILVRILAALQRVKCPGQRGDNGATLKATTVVAMLNWLGVKPSYSRPRVSDDNAYAESLFRTAKYRPEFPAKGFSDLDAARGWAAGFVRWYNHDHRHSGIGYVSPAQRHSGEDRIILAARHALYLQARALKPARWSGKTRNWAPIGAVTLNPERDCVIKAHLQKAIQPLAA